MGGARRDRRRSTGALTRRRSFATAAGGGDASDARRFYVEHAGDLARVAAMEARLAPARARVVDHALWREISTRAHVRAFTEVHCFAVWDFMSLLKALQRELTCVDVDWRPPRVPQLARFKKEASLRAELNTANGEAAALRAQCSVLSSQLATVQQGHSEHALQLKDVAVLRAQQGFVQAAADRAELSSAEQARVLGEVRRVARLQRALCAQPLVIRLRLVLRDRRAVLVQHAMTQRVTKPLQEEADDLHANHERQLPQVALRIECDLQDSEDKARAHAKDLLHQP